MSREQFFVPVERQLRVHAALQQDLVAAQGDRLLDLAVQLFARDDVALGIARPSREGAEAAAAGADVRVVDVAVDVVGAIGLGMQPAATWRRRAGQAPPGRATPAAAALRRASAARRLLIEDFARRAAIVAKTCRSSLSRREKKTAIRSASPCRRPSRKEQLQPLSLPRPPGGIQVVAEIRETLALRACSDRRAACRAISANRVRPSSRAAANACDSRADSTPGRATHKANTNGKPGPARPLLAKVPDELELPARPAACPGRRSASPRRPCNPPAPRRWEAAAVGRHSPNRSFNQDLHQGGAGPRALVQRPACESAPAARGCRAHAPHRAVAGDAGVGDDRGSPDCGGTRSTGSGPRRSGLRPSRRPAGWADRSRSPARAPAAQAEHQRPGVQIPDRPDAEPFRHRGPSDLLEE